MYSVIASIKNSRLSKFISNNLAIFLLLFLSVLFTIGQNLFLRTYVFSYILARFYELITEEVLILAKRNTSVKQVGLRFFETIYLLRKSK